MGPAVRAESPRGFEIVNLFANNAQGVAGLDYIVIELRRGTSRPHIHGIRAADALRAGHHRTANVLLKPYGDESPSVATKRQGARRSG
jgi:hypothetical protein